MKRIFFLTTLLSFLPGCAIPKATFRNYTENFTMVKTTAQQLYLHAGAIAENIADRPATEGTTTEKFKKLASRKAALESRLEALDLIDQYNRALTALASGTNPKQLQDDLTTLGNNLASFKATTILNLASKTSPYLAIVAQGITAIDNAIKRKNFTKIADEAQPPLIAILDILIEDVNSLQELFLQEIKQEQDPHREQLDSEASRFYKALKHLKLTDELNTLLNRHNEIRKKMMREEVKLITYKPDAEVSDPTLGDIEALNILTDQTELNVIAYNKIEQRLMAQTAMIDEYKKTLQATKKAFITLNSETKTNRYAGTGEFIRQALELRKATLKIQGVQ